MESTVNKGEGQVLSLPEPDSAAGKSTGDDQYPLWLATFLDVYQRLSTDNLNLLTQVYSDDVRFQDPLHVIEGQKQLIAYFDLLYTNLSECRFTISEVFSDGAQAAIYWQMIFVHPKLNGGKAVQVEGHSRLKAKGDRVGYHRDYLDVGAMLYEHIPVLGRLVKLIKSRAGQ
ncbi:nuclear transport factor 2 family protein [Thalassotalea mangrovi]|uniref:Nuclear transport factor 2 family protein n=1 Tax=Thalassotalea mangrovi TaxID=2572245 RepID=A0A4U1B9L5_9GAMM|nr:nuclear transport factor 2 family protein [Thalassotalea mangrovi]TKB47470.1 nuclear transport factor 2 family protein [Thalassotalea mangrovi]